jgi:hypothetical protein
LLGEERRGGRHFSSSTPVAIHGCVRKVVGVAVVHERVLPAAGKVTLVLTYVFSILVLFSSGSIDPWA